MKTLTFLLSTVLELYTMALLLRVWMQWARCDFYNPFSQFVVKSRNLLSDRCAALSRRWVPSTVRLCWWRLF